MQRFNVLHFGLVYVEYVLLYKVYDPLLVEDSLADAVSHQCFVFVLILLEIDKFPHDLFYPYPPSFKAIEESENIDRAFERPDHLCHMRLAERFGVHNDEVKGSPGGRDLVKFSKVKPMKFLFLFV